MLGFVGRCCRPRFAIIWYNHDIRGVPTCVHNFDILMRCIVRIFRFSICILRFCVYMFCVFLIWSFPCLLLFFVYLFVQCGCVFIFLFACVFPVLPVFTFLKKCVRIIDCWSPGFATRVCISGNYDYITNTLWCGFAATEDAVPTERNRQQ